MNHHGYGIKVQKAISANANNVVIRAIGKVNKFILDSDFGIHQKGFFQIGFNVGDDSGNEDNISTTVSKKFDLKQITNNFFSDNFMFLNKISRSGNFSGIQTFNQEVELASSSNWNFPGSSSKEQERLSVACAS